MYRLLLYFLRCKENYFGCMIYKKVKFLKYLKSMILDIVITDNF